MSSRKRGPERKKKKWRPSGDVISLPRVLPMDTDDEDQNLQLTTRAYATSWGKQIERLKRKKDRKQQAARQPPTAEACVVQRNATIPKQGQRTTIGEYHGGIHRDPIILDDDESESETSLMPRKRRSRRRLRSSSPSPPVSPSPSILEFEEPKKRKSRQRFRLSSPSPPLSPSPSTSESSSSGEETPPPPRKRSKLPANSPVMLLNKGSIKTRPSSLEQYNSVLAQCTDPTIVSPSPSKTKTKKGAKDESESSILMSIFADKQDEPHPPTKSKRKRTPPRKAKQKAPPRTHRKALRTSANGDIMKASTFTECMQSIAASNPQQIRILHKLRQRLRTARLDPTVYQRDVAPTADPSTLEEARQERRRLERQVAALRTKEGPRYHRALPVDPPVVVGTTRPATVDEFLEALEEEASLDDSGEESEGE